MVEFLDIRVIDASLEERRNWIREQKKLDRLNFDASYSWLPAAGQIGEKEALRIAYLFFLSADGGCGGINNGVLTDGVWRFDFRPGLQPRPDFHGFPIFVDAKTGQVWQEGQKTKVDAFALIRYE